MIRALFAALLAASLAAGCADDKCKAEAPSFQLDLAIDRSRASAVQSIDVEVVAGTSGWRNSIMVGTELADGATSVAVVLDPPPTGPFALRVSAIARDRNGDELARGEASSAAATADGCNRLAFTLAPATPFGDAGVEDAAAPDADGGVAQTDATPLADALPTDDAQPGLDDAALNEDASPLADALPGLDATVSADAQPVSADAQPVSADAQPVNADAAVFADANVLADAAVFPDAQPASPDAMVSPDGGGPVSDAGGIVPFANTPLNFDPTQVTPQVALNIDCGTVVFDSTTLTFDRPCGGRANPVAVRRAQGGGATDVAIIPVTTLGVAAASVLIVRGDYPVIIAVYGDATIAGRIDATPSVGENGAGGVGGCGLGTGWEPVGGGRGGGGGGAFATNGGRGGDPGGAGAGAPNGVSAIDLDLSPLRAGCEGGRGGELGGNGGRSGGAVQIASSRAIIIPAGGAIAAGGGGGTGGERRKGAGGGGSGGGILLDSATITIAGALVANGGGGGEGGPDCNCVDGARGDDGVVTPSLGGDNQGQGGSGGDGASNARPDGDDGNDGISMGTGAGGGGGGGGLGVIRLRHSGACTINGAALSPAVGC